MVFQKAAQPQTKWTTACYVVSDYSIIDNTDNIGSVFLVVDSLLLFVMCTVTLQRLRDSVTQIYTFIIIIIIIIIIAAL